MRSGAQIAFLGAITVLAACSTAPSGSPPVSPVAPTDVAPTSISSPSPSPDAEGSAGPGEVIVGGARPVTVRLPSGNATEPAPLLIMLHGYGDSTADHRAYFALDRYAGDAGMVVVYPEGTRDRDGNLLWNGTDTCCDFYGSGVDDVAYLASLVAEIGRNTPIDVKRVYLVGHSNGGFMSYRMACEQAGVFAAVVSLAGATFDDDADCAPSEPVAILEIHGTADDVIRFAGGTLSDIGPPNSPHPAYPGAKETVASWAAYNGCASALTRASETLDIDAVINGPNGPKETTIETATDCDPGGHVELWTIPGGGHGPILSRTFGQLVIDFLLAHPKP